MRDDALQPIQLPAHAWTQPETTAALRERRVGVLFELARKYGASQTRIANVTGMGQAEVSRIMNGDRHVMGIDVLERIADGLTMPDEQRLTLGLAPRYVGPAGVTLNPEQDGDAPVLRREFMRLSAGALGLAATNREVADQKIFGLEAGQRIGPDIVDQMRQRITRLRQLDNHLGGADTYQLFANEVGITRQLLKEGRYAQATKKELLGIYAEQAQQAGWAAFDAGWHSEARSFYEWSFEAAKEAGDAGLSGNALAHIAYQLVSNGQPDVKLAKASSQLGNHDAHPTVHALLQERCAWTYAVAGQPAQTERALALAEEALSQVTEHPGPDWAAWVDRTELKIMTGRCWTALRRPLRAVPALEETLNADYAPESHPRDWSLYAATLADAYVDAGEIDQAAELTGRALDLSEDVASIRPRTHLASVITRLKPYRSVSQVSDLLMRSPAHPTNVGL